VLFADSRLHLRFRSLHIASVRFGAHAATLRGNGIANGRRVRFTAVAVDNGARRDVFRIAWGGGRTRGGVLLEGGLTVR
jgi:hypothetical protein